MTEDRQLFRHTLATLAYRGGKAVRGAKTAFGAFQAGDVRRPGQLLAHIGDLLDWALSIAKGTETWQNSPEQTWPEEVARFHASLKLFDEYLASDDQLHASCERLFQGPIADALTHVGQIAMLRRISGEPIRGENYSMAKIEVGRIGAEQGEALREFD